MLAPGAFFTRCRLRVTTVALRVTMDCDAAAVAWRPLRIAVAAGDAPPPEPAAAEWGEDMTAGGAAATAARGAGVTGYEEPMATAAARRWRSVCVPGTGAGDAARGFEGAALMGMAGASREGANAPAEAGGTSAAAMAASMEASDSFQPPRPALTGLSYAS